MVTLWVGGMVEADIADSFRHLRNTLEQTVNAAIQGQEYGEALASWDVVIAVRVPAPSEHVRYHAQTKATDIRVVLNHAHFVQASLSERADLLATALLASLHRLRATDIAGVDFDQLAHDVSLALGRG
jgi:hypothetical protein